MKRHEKCCLCDISTDSCWVRKASRQTLGVLHMALFYLMQWIFEAMGDDWWSNFCNYFRWATSTTVTATTPWSRYRRKFFIITRLSWGAAALPTTSSTLNIGRRKIYLGQLRSWMSSMTYVYGCPKFCFSPVVSSFPKFDQILVDNAIPSRYSIQLKLMYHDTVCRMSIYG